MVRIAVVGPESSGKTTLSIALASHYGTLWVREMAREYLTHRNGAYGAADMGVIARMQLDLEVASMDALKQDERPLLICDTDMITIRIWSQEVFGAVDELVEELVRTTAYDQWLLLKPDIPWEADPLRENPLDRDRLFAVYERTLQDLGRPYTVIGGSHEARMNAATQAIDPLRADR